MQIRWHLTERGHLRLRGNFHQTEHGISPPTPFTRDAKPPSVSCIKRASTRDKYCIGSPLGRTFAKGTHPSWALCNVMLPNAWHGGVFKFINVIIFGVSGRLHVHMHAHTIRGTRIIPSDPVLTVKNMFFAFKFPRNQSCRNVTVTKHVNTLFTSVCHSPPQTGSNVAFPLLLYSNMFGSFIGSHGFFFHFKFVTQPFKLLKHLF